MMASIFFMGTLVYEVPTPAGTVHGTADSDDGKHGACHIRPIRSGGIDAGHKTVGCRPMGQGAAEGFGGLNNICATGASAPRQPTFEGPIGREKGVSARSERSFFAFREKAA
ncbi:hypothetical protein [Azospirillum melinis]|uniref:hypothetical protein n=1 Tax=Azospirillum melinis TaxID=328839 RepID=UPI003756C86B